MRARNRLGQTAAAGRSIARRLLAGHLLPRHLFPRHLFPGHLLPGLGAAAACVAGIHCGSVSQQASDTLPRRAAEAPRAHEQPASAEHALALRELREFETERRRADNFGTAPLLDEEFGADPYRLARLSDGQLLGVLRGSAELVRLDAELVAVERVPAPRRASALAVAERWAFVAGELDGSIRPYALDAGLREESPIAIAGVHSLRALAHGEPDTLYAASDESQELFVVSGASTAHALVRSAGEIGRGTLRLVAVRGYLVAICLLSHSLVVLRLDADGWPTGQAWRAVQDGPFWGLSVLPFGAGLAIAASGAEDHPLDRRSGSFGYVDSFLYLYEFEPGTGLSRRLAVNASEAGVLTPRALSLETSGAGFSVRAEAYGSARSLRLELGPDFSVRRSDTADQPPGSADMVQIPGGGTVAANPLLDAWCVRRTDSSAVRVVPVPSHDARTPLEKLGEALEFTTLLAPNNVAVGAHSRFTCETCHFEGAIDGRIHHTGRGDVVATTKPLRGLFNDRPYFSRALDHDLTQMVDNEFRTAGAGSGTDPWFDLDVKSAPWLRWLGLKEDHVPAIELRRALLSQFILAAHPPNPFARPARSWSRSEERGAALFQQHCEACHEARLASDDPKTRVPFERWHDFVFSDAGPIVWARDSYERTGIEPLVHPRGARVPSLRRIYAKYPYFTNGTSPSLADVVSRARHGSGVFFHALSGSSAASARSGAAPAGLEASAFGEAEQRDLVAFLRLL